MSRAGPVLAAAAFLFGFAPSADAQSRTTVMRSESFDPDKSLRVIVVTTECAGGLDCFRVEAAIKPYYHSFSIPLRILSRDLVRQFLFEQNLEYSPDTRGALFAKFNPDAFLEMKVPHSERADNRGQRNSAAEIELTLVTPDGNALFHALGTARGPTGPGSSEKLATKLIECMLKTIYKKGR